jgi:hypothetical protein
MDRSRQSVAGNAVLARNAMLEVLAVMLLATLVFAGAGLWLDYMAEQMVRAHEIIRASGSDSNWFPARPTIACGTGTYRRASSGAITSCSPRSVTRQEI